MLLTLAVQNDIISVFERIKEGFGFVPGLFLFLFEVNWWE